MTFTLDRALAVKVLEVVDTGLVSGLGTRTPGQMCVEAAVCFAMGLPHGDKPTCVAPALRALEIKLNDAAWSSPAARAKGLRRLALAQLGSAGALDEAQFAAAVADMTVRLIVPRALRQAAAVHPDAKHKATLEAVAVQCEREGTNAASAASDAARAARAARYAASDAASAANYAARAMKDLTPEQAYERAAQWGSYMRSGDPGACMYGFDERGTVQSEQHRANCLAYIDGECRAAAALNDNPAQDNRELDELRAYIAAAPVAT